MRAGPDIAQLRAALATAARLHAEGFKAGLPFFLRIEAELERAERQESASERAMRLATAHGARPRGAGKRERAR